MYGILPYIDERPQHLEGAGTRDAFGGIEDALRYLREVITSEAIGMIVPDVDVLIGRGNVMSQVGVAIFEAEFDIYSIFACTLLYAVRGHTDQ